jgi:hypothetical protein
LFRPLFRTTRALQGVYVAGPIKKRSILRFTASPNVPLAVLLLFTILGSMLVFTAIHVPQLASAESLGAWTPTANYPFRVEGLSCAASGGYIYCVGGDYNNGSVYHVYYARISSSGVGSWAHTKSYPLEVTEPSCAISGGYIYCVGGSGYSGPIAAVYFAQISSSGVGAWANTTSYPRTTSGQQSCVTSGGYIYCMTGSSVYYATVSSSGVGTWTLTTSYPIDDSGAVCTAYGDFVYCVGGYADSDQTAAVYYAPISSSGVGAWTRTTSYPFAISGQFCGVFGGYMYCVTGATSGGGLVAAVYYAPISSSGVGAWTRTTNYPNYQWKISCAISGGYIYCVGAIGWTVYYAPITPITTSIHLSPSSGNVGTSVTIAGVGLNISHNLTVMYDNSTAGMPTTCITDASGNISSGCTFTVPTSALGPHTVTVSDGTYVPTATFTVRVGWHIVPHGGGSHMCPRMIPT